MAKVVVVTGASSGIGAATARLLGKRGESVVLAARREGLLREVAAELVGETLVVPTDVTKRVDVERLRDQALERFGRIDVWVNNAGRGINRKVEALTEDDAKAIFDVVVMSVLYGMQAVLPHFKERREGHIVNVSSFLGRVPLLSYRSVYSASKSAVNVLSANLRMDLAAEYPGVHVSVVMPGIVDTAYHDVAGPGLKVRAGGFLGPTRVESAEEVAAKIVEVIDRPAAETYTNASTIELVGQYFKDVGAFEENLAKRRQAS
ncbi:MAG TPA: SDR family oxidoreductase, partial [Nitrososphaerales archaeon]|nr:SDR family oxidoreductase [Nitrososphaerales archaeon]